MATPQKYGSVVVEYGFKDLYVLVNKAFLSLLLTNGITLYGL